MGRWGTHVEISQDINLEDYIDEFDDETLISELKDRGYKIYEERKSNSLDFDIIEDKIKFIFKLMNLNHSHGKDKLLKEISELF